MHLQGLSSSFIKGCVRLYQLHQVSTSDCARLTELTFRFSDILSFYKEEQDGEVASYIHARSRLSKKTLIATLYEVIDDVVAAVERIRCALGDGKAREAWDSFARGYVGYHVNNPRYRLEDVFGAHTIETRAV